MSNNSEIACENKEIVVVSPYRRIVVCIRSYGPVQARPGRARLGPLGFLVLCGQSELVVAIKSCYYSCHLSLESKLLYR